MPPRTLQAPVAACRLRGEPLMLAAATAGTKARTFRMLVHTGQPVRTGFWGVVVIDLAGITYEQKMPLLQDHDTGARLGYTTRVWLDDDGLRAEGVLLDTELAQQVAAEADQGMPFQASCYLQPDSVEEVAAGASVKVNGHDVSGPAYIFRQCTMREVTLTVLGADDATQTEVLSAGAGGRFLTVQVRSSEEAMPPDTIAGTPAPATAASQADVTLNQNPAGAGSDVAAQVAAAMLAERRRAARIHAAADPSQTALAQRLIDGGVELADAMEQLQADSRARLGATRDGMRQQAEPLAAGESATEPARVPASPALLGPEAARALFRERPEVRREFAFGGLSDERAEAVFLAYSDRAYFRDEAGRPSPRFSLVNWNRDLKLSASLPALSSRAVVGRYFLALDDQRANDWLADFATVIETDQLVENINWLSDPPALTRHRGERRVSGVRQLGLQLIGESYTNADEIKIDDLRRDKTGRVLGRVEDFAAGTYALGHRLLTSVLTGNPNAGDGIALFSTTRTNGDSGTIDNDLTVSVAAVPNTAGTAADPSATVMAYAIMRAIQRQAGFKNSAGDPLNAINRAFSIMVPPHYMQAALAAVALPFVASGMSNLIPSSGFTFRVVVNPRLTANVFYVACTSRNIRALVLQDEQIGAEALRIIGPESENAFWTDKIAYGAKRISAAGAGRAELIHRVNVNA